MRRSLALLAIVWAVGDGFAAQQTVQQKKDDPITLAVVGGRLIDGHGGIPLENSVILIAGSRIAKIGTTDTLPVPAGVKTVSSDGMTVLPGLIDMHVHFMVVGHNDYGFWFPYARSRAKEIMDLSARMLLSLGITTVKDCSGPIPDIVQLRDAINKGEKPGPRSIVTGPFLQRNNSPASDYLYWSVASLDEARQKLKLLLDAGVDQIKTAQSAQLGPDIVKYIVSETHKAGKHITAHVNSDDDMRVLLDAGVDARDTFEHVGGGTAPRFDAELVEKLRRSGVGLVPTMIALEGVVQLERFPEYAHDPSLARDLPPDLVVDGDPLTSIREIRRVAHVVKDGKVVR